MKRVLLAAAALIAVVLLGAAVPPAADARQASAAKDGRPNILVIMTDDEAQTDVALMPNVQKLLVAQGTTFADTIDSFPLCCPARATFITGQYAHNHGVFGNFYPFGWYGMKDRGNILPAWLQKAGYNTGLVGKWLNGYGARDAHGEVPKGFDMWRGLLDVSAYDYGNFVMNVDGKLKTWGDAVFAKKLVKFAKIEATKVDNPSLATTIAYLQKIMGKGPYKYWGAKAGKNNYSPDVTGKVTEGLVAGQAGAKDPFFIWWAPAAPHREDVATTLMGRPGRDPQPPPRYANKLSQYTLPRPPSFNEADVSDKPDNIVSGAPALSDAQIAQLQLDYEGRAGALRAVDDHVKTLVDLLKKTRQLDNTLIVFVSDNGWMQGEHRIPGDKYLPYEPSLRVPFILRGPGIPKGKTVHGQVSNIDFASTLVDAGKAKAGRVQDGVSLLPIARGTAKRPDRVIMLEALNRLFDGDFGSVNGWDRPYTGVRTDRYTYVVYTESGEKELYDRQKDPDQLDNVADTPAYEGVQAQLADRLTKLAKCVGGACRKVKP